MAKKKAAEATTLADLDKKPGVTVELSETKVEFAQNDMWNHTRRHEFKDNTIRVIKVNKDIYTEDRYHLHYYDTEQEHTAYIPGSLKLKISDSKKAKAVEEKFYAYCLKNLSRHLHYSGGAIGSDPEIFVENGNGDLIPAFKFLGSKEKPDRAADKKFGDNALYWDGFQAEFTTFATSCMGWHSDSLQIGLEGLLKKAKEFCPEARLSLKTVFDIPIELIRQSAPEHVAFGCDRSFNVYGLCGLEAPGHEVFIRSAGGHIHFGYNHSTKGPEHSPEGVAEKKPQEIVDRIVKALDAILGVACVSMFAKYDDPRRRQMYGLAREYRLPPHGLEYRVLSNAWLCHPLIANIIFDLARRVFAFGEGGFMKEWKADEAETIRVINTCNVDGAREILNRNKDIFRKIINASYYDAGAVVFVHDAILNGMETIVENPADIANNWELGTSKWVGHCAIAGKNVGSAYRLKKKV